MYRLLLFKNSYSQTHSIKERTHEMEEIDINKSPKETSAKKVFTALFYSLFLILLFTRKPRKILLLNK